MARNPTPRPSNFDKQWFHDRLRDKQLSVRQVARILGVNASMVSRRLSGETFMLPSDIEDLAHLLGVSYEDVLVHAGASGNGGNGPAPKIKVARVAGPDGTVTKLRGKAVVVASPIAEPGLEGVMLRTPGQSWDGWVLLYKPAANVQPEAVDRLSVVRPVGGKDVVALPTRGRKRGTWNLTALGGKDVAAGILLAMAVPVLWAALA